MTTHSLVKLTQVPLIKISAWKLCSFFVTTITLLLDYYWDTCGSPVVKWIFFFSFWHSDSFATKWQSCAIVPNWPLRPQSTGVLIGLDVHTLTTQLVIWLTAVIFQTDRIAWSTTRFFNTYNNNILFAGHFVISFGARCSSGYVRLQN
jgi:hypothetical protein